MVQLLADATMRTIEGESHLSGLGLAEEILSTLMELHGAGAHLSAK